MAHIGRWHLHVTIAELDLPRSEQARLRRRIGDNLKFIEIENIMRDSSQNYRELIPSCEVEGTLSAAQRELFDMGWHLTDYGLTVTRLKIEGDRDCVDDRHEPLYWETHIRIGSPDVDIPLEWMRNFALSRTPRSTYVTIRDADGIDFIISRAKRYFDVGTLKYEACVMDTAQELDEKWFKSRPPYMSDEWRRLYGTET